MQPMSLEDIIVFKEALCVEFRDVGLMGFVPSTSE
jgi:hypothetical protein